MKNNRVHIFIFLILGSVFVTSSLHSKRGGKQKEKQLAKEILQQACNYLSSKQFSDGSWRSDEYGLLKSGQSLTPFILDAYLDTPFQKSQKHNQLIDKTEIEVEVSSSGITREKVNVNLSNGKKILGSKPVTLNGFGIIEKIRFLITPAEIGEIFFNVQVNIVPEEINIENNKQTNWIPKYGYDGGFFSSPTIAYANKGRTRIDQNSGQEYFRSYSTATCDGVLTIIALGYQSSSQEIKDAKLWLKQNQDWELPSGVPRDDPAPWAESMKLYNLMVLSETYCALEIPGNWKNKIIHFLGQRQRSDGSFLNMEGKLMKEDDPLISTTYAIIALNHILTSS